MPFLNNYCHIYIIKSVHDSFANITKVSAYIK